MMQCDLSYLLFSDNEISFNDNAGEIALLSIHMDYLQLLLLEAMQSFRRVTSGTDLNFDDADDDDDDEDNDDNEEEEEGNDETVLRNEVDDFVGYSSDEDDVV